MKDINIKVSVKLSMIIGVIVLIIYGLLIGFAYKEMSNMRRDLYAVRADYYGITASDKGSTTEYSPVDIEILSQEVKNLRIADNNATYDYKAAETDPYYNYTSKPVRVVKAKITNKESYILGFSSYNFGYVNQNGQVIRSVDVHPDDNSNSQSAAGYSTEIAQGGTTELYIYFAEANYQIEKLIYLQ